VTVLSWIAALSLASWLWLALGQGFFWRTDVRLPERHAPEHWPEVAVVIPARDEAETLPVSLASVLAQRYPGQARVILVDDNSSDGTGALARSLGAAPGALPLTVSNPGEPPAGWTGKLWALRHGVELAGEDAELLLLTDADIAHAPDSLTELVRAAETQGLDLVSQMARLRTTTGWERLIVPAFVYFFAQLYPFRWSNRPSARTAAAAGGCTLVRADALRRAGGVAAIRGAVIDDVSLARAVKRSGGRTWLGLAEQVDSVRPYPELSQLWRMVSRSAYAQLRHNVLLLIGTVLGLALVYLVPPVATLAGAFGAGLSTLLFGAAAWLLMAGTYVPMLRYYRQPPADALLLPFTALLYLLMTLDSAVQHWRGRGAAWKGRTYPAPAREPTQDPEGADTEENSPAGPRP
jgi:hopene-associated glycosyltransferase HpnB